MSELQSGGLTRTTMRECSIVKRPTGDDHSSLVHYHRPYVDASREHFYLPKKWQQCRGSGRGGKDNNEWHECDFDYAFKKDEMNGTDLMRNLRWLGQSNKIMKLANNSDNDSSDHDVVDLEDTIVTKEVNSLVVVYSHTHPSPPRRDKGRKVA